MPYLQCHYAEKYRKNSLKPQKYFQDEMVLSISREGSEFYSLWNRVHAALKDSIFGRGGGLAEWGQARAKILYPNSTQYQVCYKNYEKPGEFILTDKLHANQYFVEDETGIPQWEIKEEYKTVAEYACQRAEADYLGRRWIVWFTAELPISDGPWKLQGLPGLILEAVDADNDYQFTCIEIEQVSGGEAIAVPKKKYIRCSKEAYIKDLTLEEEDINQFLIKQGSYPIVQVLPDGSSKLYKIDVKFNYIER